MNDWITLYVEAIVYDFVIELWRNPKENWRNDKELFCYYGWIILQKQFSQSKGFSLPRETDTKKLSNNFMINYDRIDKNTFDKFPRCQMEKKKYHWEASFYSL